MSSSKDLATFREQRGGQIPPETLAVIDQSIVRLRASGMAERCLRVGDVAPDFVAYSLSGEEVSLSRLLGDGPVVLSYYRGGR